MENEDNLNTDMNRVDPSEDIGAVSRGADVDEADEQDEDGDKQ
jgi:hypothetical protein